MARTSFLHRVLTGGGGRPKPEHFGAKTECTPCTGTDSVGTRWGKALTVPDTPGERQSVVVQPEAAHRPCPTLPCTSTVRGGTRRPLRFCTEVLGFWPAAATSKNAIRYASTAQSNCAGATPNRQRTSGTHVGLFHTLTDHAAIAATEPATRTWMPVTGADFLDDSAVSMLPVAK